MEVSYGLVLSLLLSVNLGQSVNGCGTGINSQSPVPLKPGVGNSFGSLGLISDMLGIRGTVHLHLG